MSLLLMIQPVTPLSGSTVKPDRDNTILITVQVSLSCGCPVCAGGRWDASRFRVKAAFFDDTDNTEPSVVLMEFTGNTGEFSCRLHLASDRGGKRAERATIKFEADDPETGMAGRCSINIKLSY